MAASFAGRMYEIARDLSNSGSCSEVVYDPIVIEKPVESNIPTEVTMNLNINLHVYHHDADRQKIS